MPLCSPMVDLWLLLSTRRARDARQVGPALTTSMACAKAILGRSEEVGMPERQNDCCCCEVTADLTLAAWESWSGSLHPEATAEEAAALIAAMYARIYPAVAEHCTCGCLPSQG